MVKAQSNEASSMLFNPRLSQIYLTMGSLNSEYVKSVEHTLRNLILQDLVPEVYALWDLGVCCPRRQIHLRSLAQDTPPPLRFVSAFRQPSSFSAHIQAQSQRL